MAGDNASTRRDDNPWTVEALEEVLVASVQSGDVEGVNAALRVMATIDARRAAELLDVMNAGLAVARDMRRKADR